MRKREMRGKGEIMGTSYNPSVPPKSRRAGPPKRRRAEAGPNTVYRNRIVLYCLPRLPRSSGRWYWGWPGRSDWVPPEVVCPKVRVKGSLAENQTDFILCDKD